MGKSTIRYQSHTLYKITKYVLVDYENLTLKTSERKFGRISIWHQDRKRLLETNEVQVINKNWKFLTTLKWKISVWLKKP